MQKATPLVLVLILAATAAFLTLRDKPDSPPPAAPAVVASEVEDEQPAAGTESDISPDPNTIFGTLENGFSYIIYPNSEPPGRVSLRLHIAAGSLMEEDDQQGLAHFLEHMVFNGSKNYTAAELIPRMQRLGIAFGAHANAYTSFDETVYMLDLPDLSQETLDLGFTVMRDFGDGALLEEDEIESERGVILSEKMSRDTVGYRIMEKQFAQLLPESLLTRRFPIGTEEVIKSATRDRFVDFYQRFYTPERMTFIVVGDIDPDTIKERIHESFASLQNPASPGADPDLGPVKLPEGLETSVFADKELTSTDLSLMLVRPHVEKPDTIENRVERFPLLLAHSILSRRFQRISQQEDSPIAAGSASRQDLFNYLELGSIDVTATDDRWEEALPILEQEFRRALDHGFTAAELAEVKANIINSYEQAVKQKPTRKSEGIATVLARTVNDNTVFSDPETNLEIAREGLDSIDAETVHQAFQTFWDAPGLHLILTGKEEPEDAASKLVALFENSRAIAVDPPAAREAVPFGYASFGEPGTVVSRNEIEDLGITQLVLSNEIRVNLKPTDFETNRIRLLARIGSGQLTQPTDTPMFDTFASAIFGGGGLGKHSVDELQEILAGKNVDSTLSIAEDAFILSGSTTPADLQLQLRLMVATLTDPGYRNEGLWQFQKAIPMIYQQLRHTTAGPQQEMQSWLYGEDFRFTIPPAAKLSSYNIDQVKEWLTPELTGGYLELSIVGDFEIDALLPELLATFGALSPRDSAPAVLDEARKINFPQAPAERTFTYESKIAQGIATTVWKTAGLRGNQEEIRRLNIVAGIYDDRLREEIREKLGASYSPSAGASGSDAMDDVGYIIGQSVANPEDLPMILETMRDLAARLASGGASDDELDRTLKPVLGQLDKSLRENSYWLSTVMSQSQAEPFRLDLARGRDADYRAITLDEINELAKKYLSPDNALLISIQPEEE